LDLERTFTLKSTVVNSGIGFVEADSNTFNGLMKFEMGSGFRSRILQRIYLP
jgi:hypothetical protein